MKLKTKTRIKDLFPTELHMLLLFKATINPNLNSN